MPFLCTKFLKGKDIPWKELIELINEFLQFARQLSRNEATTFDCLSKQLVWPLEISGTIAD